jgi:hypothetical protein
MVELETRWIVDLRFEIQRCNRTDTGYCHEPANLRIMTRQVQNLTMKILNLPLESTHVP